MLVSFSSTFRSASGLVAGSGEEQETTVWEMEGGGFESENGLEHLSSGSESDSSMLILARLDAETI